MGKILLVGDIGEGDNHRYHIGDESMFYYNFTTLQQNGHMVFATSRSKSHSYISPGKELLAINFFGKIRGKVKLLWILATRRLFLPNSRVALLAHTLKGVDVVVISGGGNLNSIWPGHLYFRFFVGYLAHRHSKKLLIAGQTLGPIDNFFDSYLLRKLLQRSDLIGVRDRAHSHIYFPKKCLSKKLEVLDDALQPSTISIDVPVSSDFRIGYSLHPYSHSIIHKEKLQDFVDITHRLAPGPHASYLLSHLFDSYNAGDLAYMKQLMQGPYEALDYKTLEDMKQQTNYRFEQIIEATTGHMDLLITTRYHGAVFALKHGVLPCMISRNTYEKAKFEGVMDSFNLSIPSILFTIEDTKELVEEKLKFIYSHLEELRAIIKNASTSIDSSRIFINYALEHDLFSIS